MNAATLDIWLAIAEEKYGSVRKAAEHYGVDHAYWWRLRDGEATNPSDEVLAKLKLRKIYTLYEIVD